MRFAKYWAKGEIDWMCPDPATGDMRNLFCWGWSDESVEDAARVGQERATKVAESIEDGMRPNAYTYGDRPLKERILEEWKTGDGEVFAAITVNSYGCDVLNTSDIMFVDIDIDDDRNRAALEAGARDRLQDVLAGLDDCGAHIYRTAGGLRYLLTLQGASPTAPQTTELMKAMGADPLYVQLCRAQACFRARLTPKSWRCGVPNIKIAYPCDDPAITRQVETWMAGYKNAGAAYAVCEYLGYHGPACDVTPAFQRVIEYHDVATRARSGLKLA